ncbi:MAG: hypothetical protein IH944_04945 [Armatimonadetes bacterium]|nr:hypothetical protein [Armatimonadota bacterium]
MATSIVLEVLGDTRFADVVASMRIMQILEATARDIDPPGKDASTGAGLVQAYAGV